MVTVNKKERRDEEFVALLARNERIIRASIRAVIRRPEDVDEVMQAVSIVAWRKFDQLREPEGFAKWACAIARYEILKFRRRKARDRLDLDEHLAEKIAARAEDTVSERSRRIAHLETCLGKLPEPRRALVLKAYERGVLTKDLARMIGSTADALYQLLRRIRLKLMMCIESMMEAEEEPA